MEIRKRIGEDTYRQALEMAVCAQDVVFWVNRWCWTFDPREKLSTIPFDLFPHQETFLIWLREREQNREGGLAEKSRDVGFTWLCACYALHCWLFNRGDATGFGSRKEDYVDKLGDPDTIFEKIRILLRNLPAWMRPAGFRFGEHDGFCKILNPANGSIIAGEAGDHIGRGGRKSRYFVDEAAFLAHPALVDGALAANTNCRFDVSTPNGTGNSFHTKRFSETVEVFTFHWRNDPRKTEEWARKKKAEIGPVAWAQEYEIDYSASLEGICIPLAWVRAAVDLHKSDAFLLAYPKWVPSGDTVAGFDIAAEGKNKSVLIPKRSIVVGIPVAWGKKNTTRSAHTAREEAVKMGAVVVNYDAPGVGEGVKGTWESSDTPLPFQANAINTGVPPTETIWPDGKKSVEKFVNLRAEIAWIARLRFEKAFEFVDQGIIHPPDEMISIPNDSRLIADLSLPLYFTTETGKVQIESKKQMRERGVQSPDFFDALVLLFVPAVGRWADTLDEDERAQVVAQDFENAPIRAYSKW